MARSRLLGWAILAAGLALAVVGAWRGVIRDVLLKAIGICFECIGL